MAGVEDDSDRLLRLGMSRPITRRDFIDGIAVSAVAATSSSPLLAVVSLDGGRTAPQDGPGYYPPTLSGMRGSHPGSFEVAHSLRDGTLFKIRDYTPRTGGALRPDRCGGRDQRACSCLFLSRQSGRRHPHPNSRQP